MNKDGEKVKLDPPSGIELPEKGFTAEDLGFVEPVADGSGIDVIVSPESERLQLLTPFVPIKNDGLQNMRVLIKAKGKCTTDHISMA